MLALALALPKTASQAQLEQAGSNKEGEGVIDGG